MLVALAAVAAALAAPGYASASSLQAPAPVPRPNTGGPFGYENACAAGTCWRLSGRSAVIHWTTRGLDAPPLNDDNRDGIPDYVREALDAADHSLTTFQREGFLAPLPDTGGGDSKPDIYITRFSQLPPDERPAGVAFAHTRAVGGAFVIISNSLDRDPRRALGSLRTTVAHELFHLVQYAFTPDGGMPRWVAEGTASAMEFVVYPQTVDVSVEAHVDRWLRQTWRPLYDERFGCDRCYGGALWWYVVHHAEGGVLPEYFGRLYGYQQAGRPINRGLQPLTETFRRAGYRSLYHAFTNFAFALYRASFIPTATYTLSARPRWRQTRVQTVAGLSMHYVPVRVRARARVVGVDVYTGGGPFPDVRLVVGGPRGRVVQPRIRTARGVRHLTFITRLRTARERRNIVLIVTSGRQRGARYLVQYAGA
ncbi:MAG: hypothetical protein ICV64_05755 [Thermoleophilia bacterium]|nr:hypothetical protein [Thermoleophilia bacterium]